MFSKPKVAYQYGQPLYDGQSTGHGVEFRGASARHMVSRSNTELPGRTAAAVRSILIQDAAGDTVRTLTGTAGQRLAARRPGISLSNPATAPRVQTPSERRDSILRGTAPTESCLGFAHGRLHRYRSARAGAASDSLLQQQQNAAGGCEAFGDGGGGGGGGGCGRGNTDV